MQGHISLDRRDFLKAAGTGIAIAGMAGCSTTSAMSTRSARTLDESLALPRKGIKKTLKYGMVQEKGTILEKFKMLKEVGYDGVEMDAPNDFDLKEVLEARDQSGLVINGLVHATHWKEPLSSPDPTVREACIEKLKTALHLAKSYGATSVLLVPAVVNEKISYADAYMRSQAEIRKAIPIAEETGVVIAIENVWNNFLLSPLEAARFIDDLHSPMVRQHFDIGNVVRYGWPEQWVHALGKRTFKLDTKGYSRKIESERGPWKGFDVEIGDPNDSVNYVEVNKALREVGYTNGWMAAEVKGGNRERMADISKRLDKVLAM